MYDTQYNNAFKNNNENLEQMAHNLNEKRRKITNNVMLDYGNEEQEICQGLECLSDEQNGKFLPQSLNSNFNFFSTQGNFDSRLPNIITQNQFSDTKSSVEGEIYNDIKSEFSDILSKDIISKDVLSKDVISKDVISKDVLSKDVISKYMLSETNSNLSDILSLSESSSITFSPKIKKQLRLNTKHLSHQNDDELIMEHLKKCDQCRNQLLILLKHDLPNIQQSKQQLKQQNSQEQQTQEQQNLQYQSNIQHQNYQQFDTNGIFSSPETKDIIILIMIGVFIIILLDIFMRK
jgi:hypothetical protein